MNTPTKTPTNDLVKMTSKELALKMCISVRSAERLISDVKDEYNLKIVCMYHIRVYLKVPFPQNM